MLVSIIWIWTSSDDGIRNIAICTTIEFALSTIEKYDLYLELAAGDEKYVRLDARVSVASWYVRPVLVATAEGKQELQRTDYADACR